MKIILTGLFTLATFSVQAANTVYVTDQLEILLRSGQGTEYKILATLESGSPLTVIKTDEESGWSFVETENHKTGWVLSRYLLKAPIARVQLAGVSKKLEDLRQQYDKIRAELYTLKSGQKNTTAENEALLEEKTKLIQEVTSIRQASSNAIQILEERNQLQERVVMLENELQKVKRDNQTLEDRTAQDWFLIGAGVLLGGTILGLILPRISWRRKSRSWDSF